MLHYAGIKLITFFLVRFVLSLRIISKNSYLTLLFANIKSRWIDLLFIASINMQQWAQSNIFFLSLVFLRSWFFRFKIFRQYSILTKINTRSFSSSRISIPGWLGRTGANGTLLLLDLHHFIHITQVTTLLNYKHLCKLVGILDQFLYLRILNNACHFLIRYS